MPGAAAWRGRSDRARRGSREALASTSRRRAPPLACPPCGAKRSRIAERPHLARVCLLVEKTVIVTVPRARDAYRLHRFCTAFALHLHCFRIANAMHLHRREIAKALDLRRIHAYQLPDWPIAALRLLFASKKGRRPSLARPQSAYASSRCGKSVGSGLECGSNLCRRGRRSPRAGRHRREVSLCPNTP